MQNEFDKYFIGLLTSLRAAEAVQKKRYDSAIDIEDMTEATAVIIDARNKIQQLRKWIEDVQRISQEIYAAYSTKLTVEQEALQKEPRVADALQASMTVVQLAKEDEPLSQRIVEPEIEQGIPEESVILGGSDGSDGLDIDSPQKFILFGKLYSVSNWQELLTKLCEAMVLMKPYKLASLSVKTVMGAGQRMLSLDEQQITEPRTKLSNGFYITTAGSPNEIKTRCERILKACGYSSDVLQIC